MGGSGELSKSKLQRAVENFCGSVENLMRQNARRAALAVGCQPLGLRAAGPHAFLLRLFPEPSFACAIHVIIRKKKRARGPRSQGLKAATATCYLPLAALRCVGDRVTIRT